MSPRRARKKLIFFKTLTTQAPEKPATPSISDDISADKGNPKLGGRPIHHTSGWDPVWLEDPKHIINYGLTKAM